MRSHMEAFIIFYYYFNYIRFSLHFSFLFLYCVPWSSRSPHLLSRTRNQLFRRKKRRRKGAKKEKEEKQTQTWFQRDQGSLSMHFINELCMWDYWVGPDNFDLQTLWARQPQSLLQHSLIHQRFPVCLRVMCSLLQCCVHKWRHQSSLQYRRTYTGGNLQNTRRFSFQEIRCGLYEEGVPGFHGTWSSKGRFPSS